MMVFNHFFNMLPKGYTIIPFVDTIFINNFVITFFYDIDFYIILILTEKKIYYL